MTDLYPIECLCGELQSIFSDFTKTAQNLIIHVQGLSSYSMTILEFGQISVQTSDNWSKSYFSVIS